MEKITCSLADDSVYCACVGEIGGDMSKRTDTFYDNKKIPGMYHDGHGLYLRVQQSSKDSNKLNKTWILRWGAGGKNTMGLGRYPEISLKHARSLAAEAHEKIAQGVDPKAERDLAIKSLQIKTDTLSFQSACNEYIKIHDKSWKNKKHAQQWRNTLIKYVYPMLGEKTCEEISSRDVVAVLKPIWTEKTETATRVRSRMENVFDWAITMGHRTLANPARWKGQLEHVLNDINKRQNVKHHPALPYEDIPSFFQQIMAIDSMSAMAIALTILTACRTSEVINAQWEEFDLDNKKLWVIPKERMKAGQEHEVPLSSQAIDLLKKLQALSTNAYVFPSSVNLNKPLSNMAMLSLLKRINRHDITIHGFRSSFREWGADKTEHSREVLEYALAHKIANDTEGCYQRRTMLEKRAALMKDWGDYCSSQMSL